MSRTLIDIDDDALARAAFVLGTSSKVETVNRALQLVAERASQQAERDRFDERRRPPPGLARVGNVDICMSHRYALMYAYHDPGR